MFKMLRFRDYVNSIVNGTILWFMIVLILSLLVSLDSESTTLLFLIGLPFFVLIIILFRIIKINCDLKYRAKEIIEVNNYIEKTIVEENNRNEELIDNQEN